MKYRTKLKYVEAFKFELKHVRWLDEGEFDEDKIPAWFKKAFLRGDIVVHRVGGNYTWFAIKYTDYSCFIGDYICCDENDKIFAMDAEEFENTYIPTEFEKEE